MPQVIINILVYTKVKGMIIRNSGHWLIEEVPDQVIPQLIEFLNGKF